MAAGLGAQEAFRRRKVLGPATVVLLLTLAWVACLVFRTNILAAVTTHIESHGVRHVDPTDATSRIIDALFWSLMLGVVLVGLLVLRARKRLSRQRTAIVVAVLLAGDLLLQGTSIQRTVPSEPFTVDPPLAALAGSHDSPQARGRLYRYELPFLVSERIEPSMLNTAASLWQWQTLRPNMGFVSDVHYTLGYGVSMSTELEELWRTVAADEDLAFTLTATEHVLGLISADDFSNRSV